MSFTSTWHPKLSVPHWQSILVAVHELGHNFGAAHDCCSSGCANTVEKQNDLNTGMTVLCPTISYVDEAAKWNFPGPSGADGRAACVPYKTASLAKSNGGYLMYPTVSRIREGPLLVPLICFVLFGLNRSLTKSSLCFSYV